MEKRVELRKTDILSASEIGQYQYCSCAWLLQRYGYEPESSLLESGKKTHVALGNTIDGLEIKRLYTQWIMLFGFITLCVAFLLLFLEVML